MEQTPDNAVNLSLEHVCSILYFHDTNRLGTGLQLLLYSFFCEASCMRITLSVTCLPAHTLRSFAIAFRRIGHSVVDLLD